MVVDRGDAALGWASAYPAGGRVIPVVGDAADEAVTGRMLTWLRTREASPGG